MLLALSWHSSKRELSGGPSLLSPKFLLLSHPEDTQRADSHTEEVLPQEICIRVVPVEPGEPCWSHRKAVMGISLRWCQLQAPRFFDPGLLIQAQEFLPGVVPTFSRMAFQKCVPGCKGWEDNLGKPRGETCVPPRKVIGTLTQAGLPGEGFFQLSKGGKARLSPILGQRFRF